MDYSNRQRAWKILRPLGTNLAIVVDKVNNMLVSTSLPIEYRLDIQRCKPSKGGRYIVKYGYLTLLKAGESDFPFEKVWIKGVTPKVTHFLWLVFKKGISIIDNLRKRGQILVNRCSLCYKVEESLAHLC